MSEHTQFEFRDSRSASEAATLLRSLADGLDAGAELSFGDGSAAVDVPDELDVELELDESDEWIELDVEFEWERPDGAPPGVRDTYQKVTGETSTADEEEATREEGADRTDEEGGREVGRVDPEDEQTGREEAGRPDGTIEVDPDAIPLEDPPEDALVAPSRVASLARFEVYEGRDGKWRWRLVHRNGNIIATGGQGYTRRHNALKGLRSVVANAPGADVE